MSLDQIRRLKLLRDLEKSPKPTPKSEIKHRTMTTISQTDNLRKLNKNVPQHSFRRSICSKRNATQKSNATIDSSTKK